MKKLPAISSILVVIMVFLTAHVSVFAANVPIPSPDSEAVHEDLTIEDLSEEELIASDFHNSVPGYCSQAR